jgi:hypothetical protein
VNATHLFCAVWRLEGDLGAAVARLAHLQLDGEAILMPRRQCLRDPFPLHTRAARGIRDDAKVPAPIVTRPDTPRINRWGFGCAKQSTLVAGPTRYSDGIWSKSSRASPVRLRMSERRRRP